MSSSPDIRGVVFDLDGTLADTADLAKGRRTPWLLTQLWPVGSTKTPGFSAEVSQLPSALIASGYKVAVTSRAPMDYASSLVHLLGVDLQGLVAGGSRRVSDRLRQVSDELDVPPPQLLYVGDTEEDRSEAEIAQCPFLLVPWTRSRPKQLGDLARLMRAPRITALKHATTTAKADTAVSGQIDSALRRLKEGSANNDDYRALAQVGWFAALAQYGDPARLAGTPAGRIRAARIPPWTLCTDRDWSQILSTGDVERLLDIPDAALLLRLPSEPLNEALARNARRGAYEATIEVLTSLPPAVADRIRPPKQPVAMADMAQALRTGRLGGGAFAALQELPAEQRAAYAFALLRESPAQEQRRELQRIFLTTAPAQAVRCVVDFQPPALFGLPSAVITRREYATDADLRGCLLDAAQRWLPASPHGCGAQSIVSYAHDPWGNQLWHWLKDWRGAKSGPKAHLHLMEFPALVLASWARDAARGALVIPVPASPAAADKPAALSQRLARRVGELAEMEVQDLLVKNGNRVECTGRAGLNSEAYVLIDDQVTKGGRLEASRRALAAAGYRQTASFTWSASALKTLPPTACWLTTAGGPDWNLRCLNHGSAAC